MAVKSLHWKVGQPEEVEANPTYYSLTDQIGSHQIELNAEGEIVNSEVYYPYGGTAIWSTKNQTESHYKFYRYSGKERDHSGLYYYGYRYYIPWLGRWLNPDPSGTADGLNLFWMAHNNPILLYDQDGRAPTAGQKVTRTIKDNYSAERGDLLYGLNRPRDDYLNELFPGCRYSKEYPPFIINIYTDSVDAVVTRENIELWEEGNLFQLKSQGVVIPSGFTIPEEKGRKIPQNLKIPGNLKEQAIEFNSDMSKHKYLWDEYFSIAEENKKFDIAEIYREAARRFQSTEKRPMEAARNLWFTRKSKSGLAIIARSKDVHLHFILDKLDIERVVHKSKEARSITASELRYIFRNRDKFEGKIHFYMEGKEVSAPWVENPGLWSQYKPTKTSAPRLLSPQAPP